MMSDRIRVLHMVNNLNYGGLERVVAEMVQRTDAARFDTHVLALGYMGHFGKELGGFATLHVAKPMSKWSIIHPRALALQIASIAPDVVHLHSGVFYKGGLAASLARVPYRLFTDHGRRSPEPWTDRAIDRRASRRAQTIVAVSEILRDHLATFIPNPSRIRVIPNGVDTERHSPRADDGDFRGELGIATDVPVVGSIGRLETIKGYSVLVEAFARLRATLTVSPVPVLVLVGDGSERQSLEESATALGIADSVHFMGWRSDIERITRSFTVFTMSSHSEGTSISLLEAMSAGLCPVVTDVGGNAAVLGPELAHRLVPPSDPERLAAALSDALLDRPARERDSRLARERVVQHFDIDAMVHSYESLYSAARR